MEMSSRTVFTGVLAILYFTVTHASLGRIVDTKYGKVQGIDTNLSQIFYGIPYAGPPTGVNRWNPPTEPASWAPNVYNATFIRPACPQYDCAKGNPPEVCPNKTAEDCLFLNVFTPLNASPRSKLPVMLFLHGGNFVQLSGSSLLFDGQIWVNKSEVLLVTINYRLGALGFLVTGDSKDYAVGNYGYLDQRKALKWVQENIANFGGDPSQVTLFGQSAGAQSTILHIMSKKSSIYFQRAIVESAPFSITYKNQAEAFLIGDEFAIALNCVGGRDMTCLRSKTPEEIVIAQTKVRSQISSFKLLEAFEPWGPWVDGNEVMSEPVDAFQRGAFDPKIPFMMGTLSEECRLYIYSAWGKPVDQIKYAEVVAAVSPSHFFDILERYPSTSPTDDRDIMSALSTDLVFGCSSRNVMRSAIKHNSTSVWLYLYDHAFSFLGWGNLTFCQGHVCHGSELPIIFHTAPLAGFKYTPEEVVLADQMLEYWTNFAKTGDPNQNTFYKQNGKSLLNWPRYQQPGDWQIMKLRTPKNEIIKNFNDDFCHFWDSIGYNA